MSRDLEARGTLRYATMLYLLGQEPCTAATMGLRIGRGGNTAQVILRQLHHRGLVHIAEWRREALRGAHSPVWAAGKGKDASVPLGANGKPIRRVAATPPPHSVDMMTFSMVIAAFEDPCSTPNLCELVGCCRHTAQRLIRHMRALRLIYIAAWDVELPGPPLPMYRLGNRPNATRPKPKPQLDVWRDYRVRQRQLHASRRALAHMPQPLSRVAASLTTIHAGVPA
jgi:hypothetical protein